MNGLITIITDTLLKNQKCIADNPPHGTPWNVWQYKLLKKISNGVYNAEILWYYNEKSGKTLLHRCLVDYYKCEKYHRELRFTGRLLDEICDQTIKAIIIELPSNMDVNCKVHCIDALKDIEDYIKKRSTHPVIIIFSSKKAEKILGINIDIDFDILCLREIPVPIFSDSLPAEELMHLYTT